MFSGSPGPYIRLKARGRLPLRNRQKAANRRAALPGYPVDPKPFTLEEVRAYFSGDRITCLRCGKSYRRLAIHLPRIHALSEDEYRSMYGLPWRRGLTCDASHAAYSAATKQRIAEGYLVPSSIANRAKAHQTPHRPAAPFRIEIARAHALKASRLNRGYTDADYQEWLHRISLGRTPREVCADDGMPKMTWIQTRWRERATDRAAFDAIWETLPYPIQARAEMLGKRFLAEVREMRAAGLSDHTIAARTGVTAMTVNRQRRRAGIA